MTAYGLLPGESTAVYRSDGDGSIIHQQPHVTKFGIIAFKCILFTECLWGQVPRKLEGILKQFRTDFPPGY